MNLQQEEAMAIEIIFFYAIYQVISVIACAILPLYSLIRRIKKKSGLGPLKQRLGWVPKSSSNSHSIWIHAVSVGEILAVQTFIKQLETSQQLTCYLTCGTDAGYKLARKLCIASHVSYLPFDLGPAMLLAFLRIRPTALVVVEAEWWPNMIALAKLLGIQMYWINARVKKASASRYAKYKRLFAHILRQPTTIFTQTLEDRELFVQLGAPQENLVIMGEIKALNVLSKHEQCLNAPPVNTQLPILLVASIYEKELDHYLMLWGSLRKQIPRLKIIFAPRHFHWENSLVRECSRYSSTVAIWNNETKETSAQHAYATLDSHDILVVCKIGELFLLHEIASIVFLGGTFIPIGGHNILEAACWAKPLLSGPFYHNSTHLVNSLLANQGILIAQDYDACKAVTSQLLNNPAMAKTIGSNARQWLEIQAQTPRIHLGNLEKKLGALAKARPTFQRE